MSDFFRHLTDGFWWLNLRARPSPRHRIRQEATDE